MATTLPIRCSVITPEEKVLESDASAVVFPAHDGLVGVLKDRAPMLCELGVGELRVDTDAGPRRFYVDGGFAQVLHNDVTILTDRAAAAENISVESAEKALADAEAMPAADPRAAEARRKAVERAKVQLRLARR